MPEGEKLSKKLYRSTLTPGTGKVDGYSYLLEGIFVLLLELVLVVKVGDACDACASTHTISIDFLRP